jgi:hypothetical protein
VIPGVSQRTNLKENTPVNLSESALPELRLALTDRKRSGDLVRKLAHHLAQGLIIVSLPDYE